MYKCHFCSNFSKPKTPCKKVVLVERTKQYPERLADPRRGVVIHRPLAYIDQNGKRKLRYPNDPGGVGKEAVWEVSACPKCGSDWERSQNQALHI